VETAAEARYARADRTRRRYSGDANAPILSERSLRARKLACDRLLDDSLKASAASSFRYDVIALGRGLHKLSVRGNGDRGHGGQLRKSRVITLDTGRLPAETYQMIETVHERYGIRVEVIYPDARNWSPW